MALWVVTLQPGCAFHWPETRLLAHCSKLQRRDWALSEAEPAALIGLEEAAGVDRIAAARDGTYPTDSGVTWEVGGAGTWARVSQPRPRPFPAAASRGW